MTFSADLITGLVDEIALDVHPVARMGVGAAQFVAVALEADIAVRVTGLA